MVRKSPFTIIKEHCLEIFKWMLQRDAGVINYALESIAVIHTPINWLSDPKMALGGVIIANIWIGIPFNMALLLAGLQNISPTLYEAARVDGFARGRRAAAQRQTAAVTGPMVATRSTASARKPSTT